MLGKVQVKGSMELLLLLLFYFSLPVRGENLTIRSYSLHCVTASCGMYLLWEGNKSSLFMGGVEISDNKREASLHMSHLAHVSPGVLKPGKKIKVQDKIADSPSLKQSLLGGAIHGFRLFWHLHSCNSQTCIYGLSKCLRR